MQAASLIVLIASMSRFVGEVVDVETDLKAIGKIVGKRIIQNTPIRVIDRPLTDYIARVQHILRAEIIGEPRAKFLCLEKYDNVIVFR